MFPNRNLNDVSSTAGRNRPMFLRPLSSGSSSFLLRGRPPLCRAGFRSSSASFPHHFPPPSPWWSMRGPPSWPPRLPARHPAARWAPFGTAPCPRSIDPGAFGGGGWRSFSSTAGLMMERPRGDGAPPHKRRRSSEERHRRGGEAGGGAKEGGSGREQRRLETPRQNHRFKDGRDKTPNRGWEAHHPGAASSRTQTPEPEPGHRPNVWSKERGAEQPWRGEGTMGGPEGRLRGRSRDGGQGAELLPEPRCTTHHSNPWQAGAAGQRPPPGAWGGVRPEKSLQRHWETNPNRSIDAGPPGGGAAFDFSVMSYNILSQQLLQDNVYLYRHCHPGVLPWSYRLPTLLGELQQHDADILCLQEVQEDHYEDQIKPALQALGYQCEFKKRTGSKPDGCAIVFKASRLSLLSSHPVEFFRPGDALLDRDNVGLVLLLRPAATGSDPSAFICVANTHLLYNPRRGDIKLAQLAILLAEIGRLSRPPGGAANPVVLCGDFNSTPRSPLYHFLTTGGLEYRGLQSSMVSGQDSSPRGQRVLTSPLWSHSLGISLQCQYENRDPAESSSCTTVEGAISKLTVDDLATKAAVAAASNQARIEHSLKLRSSYQHRLQPDGRPEITTCHSRTAMTVDYILYTPEFPAPPPLPSGRGLQLLGRLSLVSQPEVEDVDGLPNRYHSSDHLPLLVRFRLRL